MTKKSVKIRVGIDEAGRGPWCGPVVACALSWNPGNPPSKSLILSVGDSKKISSKNRENLYKELIDTSGEGTLFFGVGVVDNFIIDEINIRQANREAMRRAIVEITRKIPKQYSEISVVIDGRDNYEFQELSTQPLYIVGGDGSIPEIGAASIIAKVFRDKLMTQYATLYPTLGLETNAGYGTKKHQEVLKNKSDITGIHRLSYKPLKELLGIKILKKKKGKK